MYGLFLCSLHTSTLRNFRYNNVDKLLSQILYYASFNLLFSVYFIKCRACGSLTRLVNRSISRAPNRWSDSERSRGIQVTQNRAGLRASR